MMFYLPDLVGGRKLRELQELLGRAPFRDGRASAGPGSSYQKYNLQTDPEAEATRQAQALVQQALDESAKFRTLAVPRRVRPVTFNRYDPGMYYRDHTDHSLLPGNPPVRGDLSMTLFLSDPDSYSGGELVVHCDQPDATEVKLPAGHAVIYSGTTMHRVNTVEAGSRLGAVTTIESLIADEFRRGLVGELAQLTRWVQDEAPQSAEERQANKIYANLLRLWARP